jgi:hypothetical protein
MVKFIPSAFMALLFLISAGQQYDHRTVQPQTATLLSHIGHQDFAKSIFYFDLGIRGDSPARPARGNYDLRFGGLSYDRDDRFDVPLYPDSRGRIVDLGELKWSDVYDIPFLYASSEPYDGTRSDSFANGRLVTSSPENTMVRVLTGHMYLVHSRDNNKDLYVMFRVESLKPHDEVTISWKVVPSPESK